MKFIFYNVCIIFYLALSGSLVYSSLTDALISIFKSNYKIDSFRARNDLQPRTHLSTAFFGQNEEDDEKQPRMNMGMVNPVTAKKVKTYDDILLNQLTLIANRNDMLHAKNKSKLLRKLKNRELGIVAPSENITKRARWSDDITNNNIDLSNVYRIDPVLNMITTNMQRKSLRRAHDDDDDDSTISSSSSREEKDFKTEFHELWLHKKFEALNQTIPRGDQVNMIAARPWGVQCGDPNQHDMPWGSCMLAIECEPEYRIYRGDYFCGRTQFVCCGLQLTNYDMYQGFDISFDEKSLSTDSDERKDRKKSSREKRKRRKSRERKKRQKNRAVRKKKIKRHIKKIIKEIKKILNKQYRNGTKQRKKRTKQLKKFIKDLKKQYKKDRQSVKDLHEEEMIKIDNQLLTRLFQIKSVNQNFVKNATFREILLNGTITKKGARMLVEAYPELNEFLETRRADHAVGGRRKSGDDYLEYDIEYGYLYY